MKKLGVVVFLSSLFSFALAAQVSRGALVVTGSVAQAVSLSATSTGQSSLVQNLGAGAIRVNMLPSADGSQTVTLQVRGNTSYSLTASVASVTGADPNATVVVTPLTTSPTGARVMALASADLSAANLAPAAGPAVIVKGSRVSRGGNDLTPDNALAVQVRVDLPAGATQAALTFRVAAQ